mgnify:CR=1 FL=1|jgi:hypothetical protein|tara:strand:- start:255 stop:476 length:222 start_codon:yes stop_codon:yes gene_type:complete
MEVNRIVHHLCKEETCFKVAEFEFTDIIVKPTLTVTTDDSGTLITDNIQTVSLAHSCEDHVEDVQEMLKCLKN